MVSRLTRPFYLLFSVLVIAHLVAPWQAAADSFDWRDVGGSSFVTGVRDQGSAGTCAAFASTAALESGYLITRNDLSYKLNLSEQHLVCADIVSVQDGGFPADALNYFKNTGIVRETELHYTAESTSTEWPLEGGWENRVVKITSYNSDDLSDDSNSVKSYLKAYGPLCVSIACYDLDRTGESSEAMDHAMLLVGYRDDSDYEGGGYYIVKNSWGTGLTRFPDGRIKWDYEGFSRIAYANVTRLPEYVDAITGQSYYTGSMGTLTWINNDGGAWSTSGTSWTMGGSSRKWLNGEYSAVFDSPTNPSSSISVGDVSAHQIDITSGATGYWFTGSGRLLVTQGGIHTQEDCTIDCTVALGMDQTWTVSEGKTLTVGGNVKMHINSLTIDGGGQTILNGTLEDVSSDPVFGPAGLLTGYRPSLTKKGNGTLVLGATNTYTGATVINAGMLQLNGTGQLPDSSDTTVARGATFDLNGVSDTVHGLSGSGSVTLGTATLSVAGSDPKTTFSGTISGPGGLTKIGSGTQVLSGANVYSGGTSVTSGTLQVAKTTSLPGYDMPGKISVATGATLGVNAGALGEWDAGDISELLTANETTFAANSFLGIDSTNAIAGEFVYTKTISGPQGLKKLGTGTLCLTGHNSYGGKTIVSGGTLAITGGVSIASRSGWIADEYGSMGAVTVDGTGSTWTNNGHLLIGLSGNGTLDVTGGGSVSSTSGCIGFEGGSTGEVRIDGTGSRWNNNADLLIIGLSGNGTLDVTGGGSVSSTSGYIGSEGGSTGEVRIDGTGSTWTNKTELYIGAGGDGTLNITGGGTVSSKWAGYLGCVDGSTGIVTVDGAGSTWNHSIGDLYVGGQFSAAGGTGILTVQTRGTVNVGNLMNVWGTGILTIDGGGQINTGSLMIQPGGTFTHHNGTLTVLGGTFNPGTAAYTIDGAGAGRKPTVRLVDGATANLTSALTVGNDYNGALEVRGGSSVTDTYGFLGYGAGSLGKVTVTGSGSQWKNSSNVRVGYYGTGTLRVEDGGVVSNIHSTIGVESNSTGMATVTGAGSQWNNSGQFCVGNYGNGALIVEDGGVISNTSHGYIAYQIGSTGEATVTGIGSQWNSRKDLFVGHYGDGTLNITGGGRVADCLGSIGLQVGSTGTVTVDGTGSTWTNSLSLQVGREGSGALTITEGGLVSTGGTLTIDYNGGGDSFINISTGGMLALFGDADDSLTEFLDLIPGTDAINYWDDSISDWAVITGATYDEDYTIDYLTEGNLAGYTMLTVCVYALGGDFDGDGDVDGTDFLIWQRGESPNPLSSSDLADWQTHFGTVVSPVGARSTAVPEPAAGFLLILGTAVMFAGCRAAVSKLIH
ncbi:MAG: autotransporter-associated beta strand repeat-containing protein [Pirellulales bacterium]|nr:autotransporter-associated beta strand repeat-containing protein [Pirellulales bacterium]